MLRICCLLLMAGLLLGIATSGFSEEYFRDGSKIDIQWYETDEGNILFEKVCFNYENNERKLEQCRREAEDYFKEECAFFKKKIKNTHQKYRHIYFPDRAKFCKAAESYEP
ncbi:MAG: hypothetical protein C0615_02000 [Desulfuromonas sp.]|nr:MAG: hypothetical protein C0615_02000 [Desulfuromonas sp.]